MRRVERVAHLAEGLEAELGEDALELVGHRLERAGEVAVLAGPVDVVEHRQQFGQHPADRNVARREPVALGPLAVVGVLGLDPLQVGGALGERGLQRRRVPPTSASGGRRASPVG